MVIQLTHGKIVGPLFSFFKPFDFLLLAFPNLLVVDKGERSVRLV